MADLIITNGDTAAETLAASGVTAAILPWRDVLHEGPLVADRLAVVSEVRAGYLGSRFGLPIEEIRAQFGERDAVVLGHARFDRIAIWLEHDLYDQLQLIQLLSVFASVGRTEGLTLVQADDFLGRELPATIQRFAGRAQPVDPAMLATAAAVWRDLAAPTPQPVAARLGETHDDFPYLVPALRRFLEELPAPATGLTRTEATALAAIAPRPADPSELFRAVLASEEAAFMGDWSFFRILDDLAAAPQPLLAGLPGRFDSSREPEQQADYLQAPLRLTPMGAAVLAAAADHVAVNGIDRWWGGTRLSGHHCWRWERTRGALVPPPHRRYVQPDRS